MAQSRTFLTDEIDTGKLRILGYEIGQTYAGEICTLVEIDQHREVLAFSIEAQDALTRALPASPIEQAKELLAIAAFAATVVAAIPLFNGWAAI